MEWINPNLQQEKKIENDRFINHKNEEENSDGKSFKELAKDAKIVKKIGKHGLSIGITFSKEDQKMFDISYGDEIDLTDAKIVKNNKI